ncbi:MAG: protein translocase subunit SecD [Desulfobacteraceae bacterium]|nr:protein translocase subunit SecD [Desulfobacteraceae bacterium]
MKNFSWRTVVVIIVVIAAIIYIMPSFKPSLWPYKKINLGLDLQGGMHMILEVQTQKAVENTMERIVQELREQLRKSRVRYSGLDLINGKAIAVSVSGDDNIGNFRKVLDDDFSELRELERTIEDGTLSLQLDLPDVESERIQTLAVEQALETIRNRVDQFGVSEPDIRIQGERRIQIQLPGIKDTQRAKELIGKTALLEFKLVDESKDINAAISGQVPPGLEVLYQDEENTELKRVDKTPFLVNKRASLTGAYLTDARVEIDSQYNDPYVSITLDKKGSRLFARVTEENVNKRLAIVLDNKIYSAPTITEKIPGGQARITGSFTMNDARDLAIVLRAGALPAPVEIIEERTVGPSLGLDSIRMGLISMCVGGIFVIFFMIVYYKFSGLIADFALILNILLIASGLAAFQATLTLPGIAGIILTIGMAVDANVLIFERIREEMNLGKTPRASVDAGYDRATLTILDANVTTLIAALVLFQFGTGAVKGFAVTLSLGVVASLFTSLILTRSIFDYLLIKMKLRRISI